MANRFHEYTTKEPKYGIVRKGFLDTKTGIQYEEVLCNEDFIDLGVAPSPKTKLDRFWYNIFHGLIMRYSIIGVIEYSIRDYFDYWKNWGKGKR